MISDMASAAAVCDLAPEVKTPLGRPFGKKDDATRKDHAGATRKKGCRKKTAEKGRKRRREKRPGKDAG